MRNMMKEIQQHLRNGEDLVLATIVASSGSAPRGAGARMVVGETGRICGTIGGGAVEYRAQKMAETVLKEKANREHEFVLQKEDVQNLGMICGGEVKVYFRYLDPEDKDLALLCERAEELFVSGKDFWLIYDLTDGGKMDFYIRDEKEGSGSDQTWIREYATGHPRRFSRDGKEYYIEQIGSSGRVYVFGCGHVAQKLVPVLSYVGFRCVAMDDRKEFANRELFPDAEEVRICDFHHLDQAAEITAQDYVCIMTRGHAYDAEIQAEMMKTPACYIGVIGSRHKIAAVQERLRKEGFTDEDFARVTTPIGLYIQAETPEEIAISIAAQMIQVRAEKNRG